MYIDTHAHIYLKNFKEDIAEVLQKSHDAGVHKILMPNIDHTSIDDMLGLEAKHPEQCTAMMGLHPCSVTKDFEKELYIVEEWLNKREFVAVGEIGTDLYWDKTLLEEQKEAFKIQVGFAKQYKIPIAIHCRDSFDETIEMVEALKDENLTGVFHCFTGSVEEAKRVADVGFYLGIGGVATFKNGGMDKVLPEIDLAHMILETDAPYLTPTPHRGKRNEPNYIPIIANKIAEYQGIDISKVAATTTRNAKALFKID